MHSEWPVHSEWPKLYGVLAILSAIGLKQILKNTFMTFHKNCLVGMVLMMGNNMILLRSKKLSLNYIQNQTLPRGCKTFFMLNSTEHEIFPARKC